MKPGIRIENGDEISDALKRLEGVVEKRITRQALLAGGWIIAREAKALAPREDGQLQASIVASVVSPNPIGPRDEVVYVGPARGKVFYGHIIEFGSIQQSARPFIRPAFDTAGNRAMEMVGTVLAREIERLAG